MDETYSGYGFDPAVGGAPNLKIVDGSFIPLIHFDILPFFKAAREYCVAHPTNVKQNGFGVHNSNSPYGESIVPNPLILPSGKI